MIPDDRELLRTVYRRLDRASVLADHPGLTPDDLVEFFRRMDALLHVAPVAASPVRCNPARREEDKPSRAPTQAPAADSGALVLYCDGGSRGNPGPAAYGVVLCAADGGVVAQEGTAIGRATNNVAEYRGLLRGLQLALERRPESLLIRSDSELLVRQVRGEYRVKSAGLKPLIAQAQALLKEFASWHIEHVPRERNAQADALVNQALDAARL